MPPSAAKLNFFDYSRTHLADQLIALGEKKFHANNLFRWVYKRITYNFDAMSDLGLALREKLNNLYEFTLPEIKITQRAEDGTVKFLMELVDGHAVEAVIMPYRFGNSLCVSSQVGCSMKCVFCASGQLGRVRNLTTAEMVGQLIVANAYLSAQNQEEIKNLVIMGTGEPFDNFDAVLEFIAVINDDVGIGLGIRHITVSTAGIPDKIRAFADHLIPANLAVSVHAADDLTRSRLMPINKAFPLAEVFKAIGYYQAKISRKVTLEYILIDGVNDRPEDALQLKKLLKTLSGPVLINLIELNAATGELLPSKRGPAFFNELKRQGLNVTFRKAFGRGIDASCGQLRAKQGGKAK